MFHAQDTISGRQGTIHANIDGVIHEIGMAKNIEVSIEKSSSEVHTLRNNWTQHRGGVMTGSISMTLYFGSPLFHKMMQDYAQTGRDKYFSLTITNNDPGSNQRPQSIVYFNCMLNKITPSKLDASADILEEDVDLSFSGMETIANFADNTI